MVEAFLDPFVLACPSTDDGAPAVRSYLRKLLQWRDISRSEWLTMLRTRSAAELIAECGSFPPWRAVQQLIERAGLVEEITPGDVFAIFTRFTDRLPTVEDTIGIDDILLDKVNCAPTEYKARSPSLAAHLERLLAFMCIFNVLRKHEGPRVLVTRGLQCCPERFEFRAVLHDLDSCDSNSQLPCPSELRGDFDAYGCAANLRLSTDPIGILQSDVDLRCLMDAIDLHDAES